MRVARIYGPLDTRARGGTVALNLYDPRGIPLDHRTVEGRANAWKISLRTGCFCNPGAGELALGLERDEIVGCLVQSGNRMTVDEFRQCVDGKSTGAVRVSFGVASTFADALAVLRFFTEFREG
jgi:molybdenum cofactor sulfurtransferase